MMCAQAMRDAFAKTETNGFVKFACLEDPAIAEALIADPRIGVVSFTGSSSVGNNVAVAAAKNNKRAVLELVEMHPSSCLRMQIWRRQSTIL